MDEHHNHFIIEEDHTRETGQANGNTSITKSGFATIIGRPNVGKSTLVNHLVGQKIAITSAKPQTTRNRIQCVLTEERGQIVFLDTPGVQKAKNKLGKYMESATFGALRGIDLVLWMVEPDKRVGEKDRAIAERLARETVPVLLLINKVDTIPKDELLPVIAAFQDVLDFAEIIPVSAKTGEGCEDLVDTVFRYLPYGPMYFDPDTITDQPQRAICAEIVREKALHVLEDEVPHGIAVLIDKMKLRRGKPLYDIDATIVCEREGHKGIIIGKKGTRLKEIGSRARYEMEQSLGKKVNLKLWVKVRERWRDNEVLMKNYGYRKDDLE